MRFFSHFFSTSLILAALFTTASAFAASGADRTKIDSGELKGTITGPVVSFKGVPFAAAPVGELRWRAPQPVAPWKGVRSAESFAPDCLQVPFPSDAAPLGGALSEDCLYVNVWAPADYAHKKLPVMVWIYGGGFVNGGTSPAVYDGTHFAERGIVFVSFNYRVGRFGFFAHPALTKESGVEPTGNFGYMDQIAALRWVQRNVHAFGGDAKNVTVFGESAGGGSVLTLLTTPAAKNLFQKAIVQSGGGRSLLMGPRYIDKKSPDGRASAEELGVNFARKNGVEGTDAAALAALRKLPAEKVVDGLNMATMWQAAETYSGPMVDGKIVSESPETALLAGRWHKVPVMIGATNSDIGFPRGRTMEELFAPFGSDADKAKTAFNPEASDNVMMVGVRIASDQMMVEPARFVARAVTAAGVPAFEYRFSYVAESLRPFVKGAPHATEIPYVFNTIQAVYGEKTTEQDSALARQANSYWANFAKTGNPTGADLPAWPAYNKESDVIMDFTPKGAAAMADPWKSRLDLLEALAHPKQEATRPAEPIAGK